MTFLRNVLPISGAVALAAVANAQTTTSQLLTDVKVYLENGSSSSDFITVALFADAGNVPGNQLASLGRIQDSAVSGSGGATSRMNSSVMRDFLAGKLASNPAEKPSPAANSHKNASRMENPAIPFLMSVTAGPATPAPTARLPRSPSRA
jgi:hypothetical protein